MPSAKTLSPEDLLSCQDIAKQIEETRGNCNRTTVWRVIARLKLPAALEVRGCKFYSQETVDKVASAIRSPNQA